MGKKCSREDMYLNDYVEDGAGGWLRVSKNKATRKGGQIAAFNEEPDQKRYSGVVWNGYIFIPGEVFSSKNSKEIYYKNKVERSGEKKSSIRSERHLRSGEIKPVIPFIGSARRVMEYKQKTMAAFQTHRNAFKEMVVGLKKPYFVEMKFVRRTHGRFDFGNITQLVSDLMTYHDWIDDDNVKEMVPIPPLTPGKQIYLVNKETPGVLIKAIDFES